ncbi:hypothetical protein KAR91_83890 [Candidatus Pacearchaeota archaeon]|nr:hypothetical protein [Candidatus Pacearchaeota archaeon]
MKVFEVRTERCEPDSKNITESVQYVTSEEDTLLSVTEHFTKYCEEYEEDLKSVKEVVTIVQHIKK